MKKHGQFHAFLTLLFSPLCLAQMSTDQRLVDFQDLAATFAKHYSFTEWKRNAVGFDGLNLAPWLERVRAAKDDTEFWALCAEYVASYQDAHSTFLLPTDYFTQLGISVDLYDDKLMIDSLNRDDFPNIPASVQPGDEILTIEGRTARDAINDLAKIVGIGNPRARRRLAASSLFDRDQQVDPRAHQIPEKATLMIYHGDGTTESVMIPWTPTGTPYNAAGPVNTPKASDTPKSSAAEVRSVLDAGWPAYMNRARKRQQLLVRPKLFLSGFGNLKPVFSLPAGFVQRRGEGRSDTLFTGSFQADGLTIGYLRMADFQFVSSSELQRELDFFNTSTDGLVVDVMRNPGGSGCLAERMASALAPNGLHSLGVSYRPSQFDVLFAEQDLELAKEFDASPEEIAELELILAAYTDAFKKNRGMTTPLPICGSSQDLGPLLDSTKRNIAYTKPVMLLIDDLSFSAAELFAAILQDNGRAMLFGTRTNGAGGPLDTFGAGVYGETGTSLATGILIRNQPVVTMEYPAAPYIENIGVRPDVTADYMTIENLRNHGKTFVEGFTAAMTAYIRSKMP